MSGSDSPRRLSLDDFRHEALAEVGSTNTECLERARKGALSGLWITAGRQTVGRGRRGRAWFSEPGNLYASLLLIDPAPMDRLGSLPLAVAVAVQDAVRRIMPPGAPDVLVKWPNDILIDRRKVCGILVEGEPLPDGSHALVIGIGINVAIAPDAGLYPVATLRDFGASAAPEELFAWLFQSMAETLSLWNRGRGIAGIMERWKRVAGGIGENITVNLPDHSISGRFAGIDDTGLLKLETDDDGTRLIAAGDVFFG
ncbi:biotin--[acetyl-CoA-carboxylase] ligase [Shinella zoogloeoides]|uniref:biotin--[acetyl-CoA-carboxylase] ligase n=1 Tax=Shinella zoogloeoides TaxID=352475 RepID=UPI00299DFC1F|nr:biotin--[acetyl-CoA-carboxylase] ligase [Shinella zoogloeoides]WPE19694.1 Bifunctional ligase/repressor BirA [Shinella zoogloeoides]